MRRLFVGFSGPVGYDFWRGGSRPEKAVVPNAVLEDVNGLLLCYEELYFLSRDFCPEDMWNLDYVKFVSDDSTRLDRARVAFEQYTTLITTHGSLGWGDVRNDFTNVIATMTGEPHGRPGIDNHSHSLNHISGFDRVGNSADCDGAFVDVGIACALDMGQTDVLTNSVANKALSQRLGECDTGNRFSDWHIAVASQIATLRVPNVLGINGGYHEAIEELRSDRNVRDFRVFLENKNNSESETRDAADEISALANDMARKHFLKAHKRGKIYTTIGRSGVGAAPEPVMQATSGVLAAFSIVQEMRFRRDTAWAAFMARLH